jgi:hypothetical protein
MLEIAERTFPLLSSGKLAENLFFLLAFLRFFIAIVNNNKQSTSTKLCSRDFSRLLFPLLSAEALIKFMMSTGSGLLRSTFFKDTTRLEITSTRNLLRQLMRRLSLAHFSLVFRTARRSPTISSTRNVMSRRRSKILADIRRARCLKINKNKKSLLIFLNENFRVCFLFSCDSIKPEAANLKMPASVCSAENKPVAILGISGFHLKRDAISVSSERAERVRSARTNHE